MILEMTNVSKIYKIKKVGKFRREKQKIYAIDSLDFSIDTSEIVGYLGVNGAGKSTTIKLVTGILVPTEGSIKVFNKDPYKYRKIIAKKTGVVFGQRSQLIWDLPAIDTLNLYSKIYEIPQNEYRKVLGNIVCSMNLEEILNIPVRHLSLGQRMCCEIACSLIHSPQLLLLDEPTIGLDIINKEKVRNFVREQNEIHGTTIMLTTHDIGDVEKLCKRVVIINEGRKIYDDSLKELKLLYGTTSKILIDFFTPISNEILEKFALLGINACRADGDEKSICIEYNPSKHDQSHIIRQAVSNFNEIKNISVKENGLEDILSDMFKHSNT